MCLSFCLGPFSQDLISIHEDDAKHQVRSYGGGPDVQPGQLYENDALREIGISPLEPLKPPAMEALEFLVECTTMIAATVQGALIPAKFYVELLQALVQVKYKWSYFAHNFFHKCKYYKYRMVIPS